jgi:hypothetical protein
VLRGSSRRSAGPAATKDVKEYSDAGHRLFNHHDAILFQAAGLLIGAFYHEPTEAILTIRRMSGPAKWI